MARAHHGDAQLAVRAAQQHEELVARARVELRERLVEHEQLRAQCQRGGQVQQLQLAAGELGAASV